MCFRKSTDALVETWRSVPGIDESPTPAFRRRPIRPSTYIDLTWGQQLQLTRRLVPRTLGLGGRPFKSSPTVSGRMFLIQLQRTQDITRAHDSMRKSLLDRLCCPECRSPLLLEEGNGDGESIDTGKLVCKACHGEWLILRGIPRFVPPDEYTNSFGEQWKHFKREQLDSHTKTDLSELRFYDVTRWSKGELRGEWILDAGCGAGRFAEIAAAAGANVVAVDLSAAVDACQDNLGNRFPETLHIVQADLYKLPFRQASFDRAYSIGVAQHTPKPLEAVRAVSKMVRGGGKLALWIYELTWKSFIGFSAWKYSLRPITRHLGFRTNYVLALVFCSILWPVWFPLVYLGKVGRVILAFFPITAHPYAGKRLRPKDCFRCVVLDTVDMYSPAYDKPQRFGPVSKVLEEEGYTGLVRTCTSLGLHATRTQPR